MLAAALLMACAVWLPFAHLGFAGTRVAALLVLVAQLVIGVAVHLVGLLVFRAVRADERAAVASLLGRLSPKRR